MTARLRLYGTLAFIVLAATPLAACQQYWRESGIWDIGEHQGLLLDVSNYYHRHAMEENGRCKSPYIDAVTHAAASEPEDGVFEVHLRYYYRDFLNDGDDDCDPKRRPLRCTIMRECHGFSGRDFLVTKTEAGDFDIIDMNGLRNNRR
ncbi:MAG: hypothetical protein AAF543_23115 [Pseudomonadota bacterium]